MNSKAEAVEVVLRWNLHWARSTGVEDSQWHLYYDDDAGRRRRVGWVLCTSKERWRPRVFGVLNAVVRRGEIYDSLFEAKAWVLDQIILSCGLTSKARDS